MIAVFRCDGSSALGMGHVSRSLALASAMREEFDVRPLFVMRDPASAGALAVKDAGYEIEEIDAADADDYGDRLREIVAHAGARALVLDVRDALSRASVAACRAAGAVTATIDDASDRRLACDLAFYPPVPQVEELDWTGFAGRRFSGWDWVVLRKEFAAPRRSAMARPTPLASDILITMGGSDPARMAEFAIAALDRIATPLSVRLVVGPALAGRDSLTDAISQSRQCVQPMIAPSPGLFAAAMRETRIAVASFGVTAYELAASGVPAVHMGLTADHARSASVFEDAGMAINLGVFDRVVPEQLADAVRGLLRSARRRIAMGRTARGLVDGGGAIRVANAIVAEFVPDRK